MPTSFRSLNSRQIESHPWLSSLPKQERFNLRVLAEVFPFRVNNFVLDHLIDPTSVPDDPIYRLLFPQKEMLEANDFQRLASRFERGERGAALNDIRAELHHRMNPHPAGQLQLNVPTMDGKRVQGLQHKYDETVLVFPAQGQTCHAYCSYCFRWPQFIGPRDMRFSTQDIERIVEYVRRHPEVQSVLLTGGDPLVMNTSRLKAYIRPMLSIPHVRSIRIGTKALAYWPNRFVDDDDADALLRLFEEVQRSGKHLALMAHSSHARELQPPLVERAIQRIRATGAIIRTQAPILRHVNNSADAWAELWRKQVSLGMIPYYMFVERDTGARSYFELPLAEILTIYNGAQKQVSGLARSARGPTMSTQPGKIQITGITRNGQHDAFVLKMLQARKSQWVGRLFFAQFDAHATFLDQLRPLPPNDQFFFASREHEHPQISRHRRLPITRGAN